MKDNDLGKGYTPEVAEAANKQLLHELDEIAVRYGVHGLFCVTILRLEGDETRVRGGMAIDGCMQHIASSTARSIAESFTPEGLEIFTRIFLTLSLERFVREVGPNMEPHERKRIEGALAVKKAQLTPEELALLETAGNNKWKN
jgi:hypothetical protein